MSTYYAYSFTILNLGTKFSTVGTRVLNFRYYSVLPGTRVLNLVLDLVLVQLWHPTGY
jgi:hypothetical protein